MRDSNIGHELKEMAQEVVRFGERCVQAGRDWLSERREEMNHRDDDDRREHLSGRNYGEERGNLRGSPRQARGQYGYGDQSDRNQPDRNRPQQSFAQANRGRGEYYGSQFDERAQSAGWDDDRGNWDYEGGPERYGASGYAEKTHGQGGIGRQYGSQYGSQAGSSDYYRGRQGYGTQGSFGSDYNTYGRSQGFGEGSGYTRQSSHLQGSQFQAQPGHGSASRYGGESAGLGGRDSLRGSQGYTDEGEMSGYGGRELGTQQYGSSSSGRYGTAPGQYGYGGYGAGSFRGVGPKNYRRSDERLAEDINERLTDDEDLDASNIIVRVAAGKVTLEGVVDQRWMKHRAEDIADACIGVKEVDNRIQLTSMSSGLGESQASETRSGTSRGSQTSAPGTTGDTTAH
jgi:hypothetical protein